MRTAALDHLGIFFGFGAIALWIGVLLLLARFCGRNERLAERQRAAERMEMEGSVLSISRYIAEQERRANRGRFRHHTRYGRSA